MCYLVFGGSSPEQAGVVWGEGVLIVLGEVSGCMPYTTGGDDTGEDGDQLLVTGEATIARYTL